MKKDPKIYRAWIIKDVELDDYHVLDTFKKRFIYKSEDKKRCLEVMDAMNNGFGGFKGTYAARKCIEEIEEVCL